MIFYRTPGSPLLHPTQAAAGKSFIQHDVPTDKAGLMAYVNELLVRPEADPDDVCPVDPEPQEDLHLRVYSPEDCRMCARSPIAAASLDELTASIEVRAWIARVENPRTLELIKAAIEENRNGQ